MTSSLATFIPASSPCRLTQPDLTLLHSSTVVGNSLSVQTHTHTKHTYAEISSSHRQRAWITGASPANGQQRYCCSQTLTTTTSGSSSRNGEQGCRRVGYIRCWMFLGDREVLYVHVRLPLTPLATTAQGTINTLTRC